MTQPNQSGQPGAGPSGRPGQMTAVMRAVTVATGPKVLRIGLVQSGKVIEERVVKQRTHVTVGPSEKNLFVVLGPNLPASFRLFELINGEYYLNFLDGMGGRVALQTGPTDLAALKGQARRSPQGAYQVKLTEDARGKITVGETTFLFQFVAPPPVMPKPQLPASVKAGWADRIDWSMTVIAAFSFLLHFGAVGFFYSDWADKVIDDEAVAGLLERIKALPPPPPVETATTTETSETGTTQQAAAKPAGGGGGGAKSAGGGGGPAKGSMSKAEGAALLSKLDQMDAATIGALSNSGSATQGVLREGNVPTGSLDTFANSSAGVGASGPGGLRMSGPGGGPVTPGKGGGGLASVGSGGKGEGTSGSGEQGAIQGPKASVSGGGSVAVGKISNADRVLAAARGRIRACYQNGLNSNPDMEGRVSFVVSVGGSGAVSNANVTPTGTISGSVVSCIQGVLKGLNFEPPEGGAAQVNGSFNFVNSNKGR
ncbi:MAG TPA: AgmX/PglI C-terminal domain-containing protein [Polyangiaceae bacterium]|nr:AgmX/PglI C-terminal domain-containing protein [Polyangiaceae bacterium]